MHYWNVLFIIINFCFQVILSYTCAITFVLLFILGGDGTEFRGTAAADGSILSTPGNGEGMNDMEWQRVRKKSSAQRKASANPTLSTINPMKTVLGLNLGMRTITSIKKVKLFLCLTN
jgi:hypothetical protein